MKDCKHETIRVEQWHDRDGVEFGQEICCQCNQAVYPDIVDVIASMPVDDVPLSKILKGCDDLKKKMLDEWMKEKT